MSARSVVNGKRMFSKQILSIELHRFFFISVFTDTEANLGKDHVGGSRKMWQNVE
jgi:hypothetical protein